MTISTHIIDVNIAITVAKGYSNDDKGTFKHDYGQEFETRCQTWQSLSVWVSNLQRGSQNIRKKS